jgi:hypothetical protein
MPETAGNEEIEDPLPCMAKRGMAEIVTEGDGFGQILIEGQGASHGPGDLRYLEGMGQSCPVMIALGREKHLGFIFKAAKRFAMKNSVPIVLKKGSHTAGFFLQPTPGTLFATTSIDRQSIAFSLFK